MEELEGEKPVDDTNPSNKVGLEANHSSTITSPKRIGKTLVINIQQIGMF